MFSSQSDAIQYIIHTETVIPVIHLIKRLHRRDMGNLCHGLNISAEWPVFKCLQLIVRILSRRPPNFSFLLDPPVIAVWADTLGVTPNPRWDGGPFVDGRIT
jgi:hypothetical protein